MTRLSDPGAVQAQTPPERRRRKLALNIGIAFVVRAGGGVAAVVMNLVVARSLGESQAGYFFLGAATVTVLATLGRLGLGGTLMRYIGAHAPEGDWGTVQAALRRACLWSLAVSSTAAITLFFSAPYLASAAFGKPAVAPVLQAIAPAIVLLTLSTLVAYALQALHKTIQSILLLTVLAQVMVAAWCWVTHVKSAVDVVIAFDVANFVVLGAGFFWWYAYSERGVGTVPAKALLSSCLPLLVANLAAQMVAGPGQFATGAYLPSATLAHFAVAQRISALLNTVLVSANITVSPHFAALYRQGKHDELRDVVATSTRLLMMSATPILVVLIMAPGWMLHWFGMVSSKVP